MNKVKLSGFIMVPAKELDAVTHALVEHKLLTQKEAGCLLFSVTADPSDPLRFNVYEEFVNQAAFDHHQARVKASSWAKITQNVERHYQINKEQ